MADNVHWSDLRPVLQDLADRIARIERHLASADPQAWSASATQLPQGSAASGGGGPGGPGGFADPGIGGPGGLGDPGFASPVGLGRPGGTGGPGVPPDLVQLARSGRMVQAIKLYRDMTGMSLKDCKYAVEQAVIRGY